MKTLFFPLLIATILSLISPTIARELPSNPLLRDLALGKRDNIIKKRQTNFTLTNSDECVEDDYLQGLQTFSADATPFCSSLIGIPMSTVDSTTVAAHV